MADPVQQPDIVSPPAAKVPPAAPKAVAPAAKLGQAKPKGAAPKSSGKPRLEPLNTNLGRSGVRQESALPFKKAAPKPPPGAKPAPGAKPVLGAKPAAPAAKGAPVAPAATVPTAAPQPLAKKAAPRAKSHYFIIENLCVGCGMCLDKCPPKVNAIGYKFYGDVQEGGFRCYIDQDACISCSACFSADECPSGSLIEVLPDGEVLDFTYTPPERLDFDLRFLHRFHREAR